MEYTALRIIQSEHQALSAMLRSLTMLISRSHERGEPPPFGVLRAMLFYIDEFPERLHHPKESRLLFPKVLDRRPDLGTAIETLESEHARGEAAVRDLQHHLLGYELLGETRRAGFEGAVNRYVDRYLRHMAQEESVILPAARAALRPEDWAELDAAFEANRDPLAGHDPSGEYGPLFRLILNTAPAPVGLA